MNDTAIWVWATRNLTRGRWFKMAQKLTLKRNYNLHRSRAPMWCQSISGFSSPPLNLASGAAVMAALQWFGLLPYTYDIRYISWLLLWNFWLYFKNIFWGWTVPLTLFLIQIEAAYCIHRFFGFNLKIVFKWNSKYLWSETNYTVWKMTT